MYKYILFSRVSLALFSTSFGFSTAVLFLVDMYIEHRILTLVFVYFSLVLVFINLIVPFNWEEASNVVTPEDDNNNQDTNSEPVLGEQEAPRTGVQLVTNQGIHIATVRPNLPAKPPRR